MDDTLMDDTLMDDTLMDDTLMAVSPGCQKLRVNDKNGVGRVTRITYSFRHNDLRYYTCLSN